MAGLHAATHGIAATLALGRTDLARAVAAHERRRIDGIALGHGVGRELVRHLAACVTLAQGVARDEFLDFAAAEQSAIHRPGGGDPAALADALRQALPRTGDDGIAAIVPDLIGEAFVLDVLHKEPQAPVRCHRRFGARVAQALVRTAQDFGGEAGTGSGGLLPLRWLDAVIAGCAGDADALAAFAASIPHQSVVLRDANLAVTERLLALRPHGNDLSDEERGVRA